MKKFNIYNEKRPLSWSAISSFEYDPEQWYRKYVLGKEEPPTKEMIFGSLFGKEVEKGTSKIYVPRQDSMEHPFRVVFDGIPLVGYADSFCSTTLRALEEYKTGKKLWDQKRADSHGQIDMYLLMNYITNKVPPDEVVSRIHWLPTEDTSDFQIQFKQPVQVHSFTTTRTMVDILHFCSRIKTVYKDMHSYYDAHEPVVLH